MSSYEFYLTVHPVCCRLQLIEIIPSYVHLSRYRPGGFVEHVDRREISASDGLIPCNVPRRANHTRKKMAIIFECFFPNVAAEFKPMQSYLENWAGKKRENMIRVSQQEYDSFQLVHTQPRDERHERDPSRRRHFLRESGDSSKEVTDRVVHGFASHVGTDRRARAKCERGREAKVYILCALTHPCSFILVRSATIIVVDDRTTLRCLSLENMHSRTRFNDATRWNVLCVCVIFLIFCNNYNIIVARRGKKMQILNLFLYILES